MIDGSAAQLRQPLTVTSSLAPTAPCSSSSRRPRHSSARPNNHRPNIDPDRPLSRRRHSTPASIDPTGRARAAPWLSPPRPAALTERNGLNKCLHRRPGGVRPSSAFARPPAEVAAELRDPRAPRKASAGRWPLHRPTRRTRPCLSDHGAGSPGSHISLLTMVAVPRGAAGA